MSQNVRLAGARVPHRFRLAPIEYRMNLCLHQRLVLVRAWPSKLSQLEPGSQWLWRVTLVV